MARRAVRTSGVKAAGGGGSGQAEAEQEQGGQQAQQQGCCGAVATWLLRPVLVLGWLSGVAAILLAVTLSSRELESAVSAFFGLRPPRWFGIHPQEKVLYEGDSLFQHIVAVEHLGDISLFIDRFSQFSSREEHRYHESLVHPAMAARLALAPPPRTAAAAAAAAPPSTAAAPLRVLLLGAGDGLAAREVLAYGERVVSVDLVDLDPHITSLFQEGSDRAVPGLVALTEGSLSDPKLTLHHADARAFVVEHAAKLQQQAAEPFDVIIVDLPDPMNGVLSDLYSVEFYREVLATLGRHGMLVTQATGLLATKGAFWSIEATMRTALAQTQAERSAANVEAETEAGQGQGQGQGQGAGAGAGAGAGEDRPGREAARMQPPDREEGGAGWARPYKAYVPSWGEWGFVIGSVDAPPPAPGQWPLLPPEGSSAALNPPRPADTNTGADPAESSAGAGTRRQRRLRYRYLNPPTVQALFSMSEDTLPQADTLVRPPRSANDPAAALDDDELDGKINTLPQANWKGTGVLYRIFSAEVARENNLDAD